MADNSAVYAFEPEHKLWFHSKNNAFGFVKDFKKATMSTDVLRKKKDVLHIYNALSSLQKSIQIVFPSSSKSKRKSSELYQFLLNLYS